MEFKRNIFNNICLAIIIASLTFFLTETTILKTFDLFIFDSMFRFRGPTEEASDIVIITIDEKSIRATGSWPWTRAQLANLTNALTDFKAGHLIFDLILSEKSSTREDAAFAKALERHKSTYLPTPIASKKASIRKTLPPIPVFKNASQGTGYINVTIDADGKVRAIPLFFGRKGIIYNHLILNFALDYLNMDIKQITPSDYVITDNTRDIKIPLHDHNKMWLNWLGTWEDSFEKHSFQDIIQAHQDIQEGKPPHIDITRFKNKICLISPIAVGTVDLRPMPFEHQFPGAGLLATAIDNIIHEKFIKNIHPLVNLLIVYIFALIPALLISESKPFREMLSLLSLLALLGLAYVLFLFGFKINFALPVISLSASYVLITTYNFLILSLDQKKLYTLAHTDELTGLYNIRYFKNILTAECSLAKTNPHNQFCVILCDIDHFKELNDQHGHQLGDFILQKTAKEIKNSLRAVDIIARYGGDEIIILLRGTPLDKSYKLAEKINLNLQWHPFHKDGKTYNVTLSMGVTGFDPTKDNLESIIKRADEALYKAKALGRNRVIQM